MLAKVVTVVTCFIAMAALHSTLALGWGRAAVNVSEAPVPVLVLKLPRSGSTWFTELLNKIPGLFISKEIVQGADRDGGRFSAEEVQTHLIRALHRPTDKLSAENLPSTRFLEDYLFTLKAVQPLKAVGFSLNLEHVEGTVHWQNVMLPLTQSTSYHSPRIIVYTRDNIVKLAVSALRGEELHRRCGRSNLREGRESCFLELVNANTSVILEQMRRWQLRIDGMERRLHSLLQEARRVPGMDPQLLRVTYEHLLQDPHREMQRVFTFLFGNSSSAEEIKLDTRSKWRKRSSDDLREVLVHYKAVEDYLRGRGECRGLLEMLKDSSNCPQCWRGLDNTASRRACLN
eukprot:gene4411-4832_t